MTTTTTKPPPLSPSELGTKEYWDKTYTHDLQTHSSTPTHTGQTWFEDVNASRKILTYLDSISSISGSSAGMSPSSADLAGLDKTKTCLGLDKRKEFDKRKTNLGLDKRKTSFLDLGTGNGEMLFLLREAGWGGRMVGVDYSGGSVEFCRRRVVGKGEGGEGGKMEFTEWDILTSSPLPSWFGNDEYEEGTGAGSGFDVVLDKGTFDAVSLCNELDEQGRRVCEGYAARVERLVRKGGLVVVTSCNWTEEELVGWFEGGGEAGLERWGRVEYPVFRFGGRQGQSVVSVVFRRKG